MPKTEHYSDNKGNTVEITMYGNGDTDVSVQNKTCAPYNGGASASAAREWARKNGLKKQ